MTSEPENHPTALRDLAVPEVPQELEARVVASLRARGTLRKGRPYGLKAALVAAAVLAAFALGRVTATEGPGNPETPRWLLLLYEDSAFQGPKPGAEASYVEEYARWAANIRGSGTPIEGAELGDVGGLLEPGATLTPREPIADGAGRLTGFFVVSASSLGEVERLAATSPHLQHGGRIGIRQMR